MGKHSAEKTGMNKKPFIVIICIVLIILGIYYLIQNFQNKNIGNAKTNESTYEVSVKTIPGEKLVLKGKADFSRYVEFVFNDNILSGEKIYEQFKDKLKYEVKKENYESQNAFKLLNSDNTKLILEIEKTDLGDDAGLNYEEIYNKYVVQIVGEYEVVE